MNALTTMQHFWPSKPIVFLAFLFLNFSAHASGIGNMFGVLLGKNGAVESTAAVDDVLIKLSAQINEKLPMAVDADTRLDNVSAVPGRHLIYHYTVVTVNGSDINVENFQRLNKPQLKDRLCGSTEMQNFLKNGVTISYLYKGKDGHPIGGTKLAPSECGYKR